MKTEEQFKKLCDKRIPSLMEIEQKWKEKFAHNSAIALGQCTGVFQAAAEKEILVQMTRAIENDNDMDFENALEWLTDQASFLARQRPHSTSTVSNLLEDFRRVATVELDLWFKGEHYFTGITV